MNHETTSGKPKAHLVYQIRIEGHLGPVWQTWFDDSTIVRTEQGETILICQVMDQAALHSLLRKIRDLGLPLVSVLRMNTDQAT